MTPSSSQPDGRTVPMQRDRSIYVQVAEELRVAIVEGRFPAGASLPSQRTLARNMGTSRDCVREALRVLAAEGLVVLGSGTPARVSPTPVWETVVVPAGATVTARMPLPHERARFSIQPGATVPLVVVHDPDGTERVYAAHRIALQTADTSA